MELYISIIGAIVAVGVSILGAILANKNSIILQTRKLKEQHYIAYIEALHNSAASPKDHESFKIYVSARDKLLLIGNEDVILKLLKYENEGIGKSNDRHDLYLTELIKAIRMDLKLKNKDLPTLSLKK